MSCLCGKYDLLNNVAGVAGVFFQVVCQRFAYCLINSQANLGVAKLGFGLTLKLGFGHLNGYNSR